MVFRYHSEDLWCSIAYFRKWVKIYQSTCRCTPPSPGMKKLDLRSTWHFGSGWRTPPPPHHWLIEINMNVIENNWGQQVLFTNLPPHPSLSIILFYAWTGNWRISISIGYGYMDSNHICHPSPAQKLICSFLDYVQLLVISQVIRAKNFNQNAKKQKRPPKSSKNKMFIFGLHSTSDDRMSNLSTKCQPKHKKQKRPPKSSKNKMFIFGLRSTSDDQLRDLSKKHQPKCKKMKKAP